MNVFFSLILREHRKFGLIFTPVLLSESKKGLEIFDTISPLNINNLQVELSESEIEVINHIFKYNDEHLQKLFYKPKVTVKFFLEIVDSELISNDIRPYIESKIQKIIQIAQKKSYRIFFKLLHGSYLLPDDEIFIEPEPAEAVFHFTKTNDGTNYFLSIQHNNKDIYLKNMSGEILCNSPAIVLLNKQIFIFPSNQIDGKKFLPFFEKESILIPQRVERKYYETFVFNTIKQFKVKANGFTINNLNPPRKVELCLEVNWKGYPVVLIKFLYGKHEFLYNNKNKEIVKFNAQNDTFIFDVLRRDDVWEKSIIEKIENTGLKFDKIGAFNHLEINKLEPDVRLYSFIEWFGSQENFFSDENFIISKNLNKPFIFEKPRLSMSFSHKTDWFDVKARVQIGEYIFSFIDFKNHILNRKKEFQLPDGNIVILPSSWFVDYYDLFIFSNEIMGELHIDDSHIHVLPDTILQEGINNKIFKNLFYNTNNQQLETELPKELKVQLRSYQQIGYWWLYNLYQMKLNGCLADDMGLGKTVQAIAIILKIREEKTGTNPTKKPQAVQLNLFEQPHLQGNPPVLIISPVSLIHNWTNELKKFATSLKIYKHIGNQRDKHTGNFCKFDVIITSYGILLRDIEILKNFTFQYIVFDESQLIKNSLSKTYIAATQLISDYKLLLTGTPIENSLLDLWAQMDLINPGILGNKAFFENQYLIPIEKRNEDERKQSLKKLLYPFLLRRRKKEVLKDLPELTELEVFCEMPDEHLKIYEEEKSRFRNFILEAMENKELHKISAQVLAGLMKLRKISNHPKLQFSNYTNNSGKFDEVTRMLDVIVEEGNKLLMFSSFVEHLKLYENYLKNKEIKYRMLTGASRDREKIIADFQTIPEISVFLISIKAGGVGLNLTAADYIFILDPWWNPATEQQAIARAHRIGRENKVFAYRFISSNSIEEKIRILQKKKIKMVEEIIEGADGKINFTENELKELLK